MITVSGRAAYFGHVMHEDAVPPKNQLVFMPGAFSAAIERHRENGTQPLMHLNHQKHRAIGWWDSIEVDEIGLRVEGRLDPTPAALALIESGKMPSGLCFELDLLERRDFRMVGNLAVISNGVALDAISLVETPSNPFAIAQFEIIGEA